MTDIGPQSRGPARYANGRFGPGNSGRPVGARNRAPRRVVDGILAHFEARQEETLNLLARWWKPEYVRLVARFLPRPGEDESSADDAAAEASRLAARLSSARAVLAKVEAGTARLADLEAALAEPVDAGAETVINGENTDCGPPACSASAEAT